MMRVVVSFLEICFVFLAPSLYLHSFFLIYNIKPSKYIYIYTRVCIYRYVCAYVYVYISLHLHTYIDIYTNIMYVYMYLSVYAFLSFISYKHENSLGGRWYMLPRLPSRWFLSWAVLQQIGLPAAAGAEAAADNVEI